MRIRPDKLKSPWFLGGFFLMAVITAASVIKNSDLTGILFSVFLLLVFFAIFAVYSDRGLSKIIIFAFILRAGLAYFQRFITPLPDSTSDAISFEQTAWETAVKWSNGHAAPPLSGAYYYSQVIAWVYYLFGRTPLLAQFLNVFFGTLLVFIVYKISWELSHERKIARAAGVIAAVFPTFNLYSAITTRESFIIFLFALSFYFFTRWLNRGRWRDFSLSVAFDFLAGVFHGAIILPALVYLFFFIFYNPKKKKWVLVSREFFIGIIFGGLILCLFCAKFYSKLPGPSEITPQKLSERLNQISIGRTSYLKETKPKTYSDIFWQTPIRIIYFYFEPFPWKIKTKLDAFGFLDVLLLVFLLIFFFASLGRIGKSNKPFFWASILILAVFSVTFAWGTSNYGTALRHRQKIAFLLIAVASLSLPKLSWGQKTSSSTNQKPASTGGD